MTPDVEFLVRQSLAVRSVADTHALLARSLFDPPSQRSINRISKEMDRMPKAEPQEPLVGDGEARKAAARNGSDLLLRAQLSSRQVPSFPAMLAHWQKHGAPVCAGLLG